MIIIRFGDYSHLFPTVIILICIQIKKYQEMKIHQFEDRPLAHYSYAILDETASEIILIDPSRDVTPYLEFARNHHARIRGVIETHPHADFASSHLELHRSTGAVIYCSRLSGVYYPHTNFDDGDTIVAGEIKLRALNTPGHSPDSISIVLEHDGADKAVFTGDTLFVGDCGRPDLREHVGNITEAREVLARQMYHSLRGKLATLGDEVKVYPAHGAGSLCGKSLSQESSSTIGDEKSTNWSLQQMTEEGFVSALISDQPFIPPYFAYDVELNRKGAETLGAALAKINISDTPVITEKDALIIDTRPAPLFKKGALPGSINLQEGNNFETWLGTLVRPGEMFYPAAENPEKLRSLIARIAKIGYESFIKGAFVVKDGPVKMEQPDIEDLRLHESAYTILDIRNASEVAAQPIFSDAIHIPLNELRERAAEVPVVKPVVVHCAGGYRSAAGSSIMAEALRGKTRVYDLGEAVKQFI
jgi:glyoxylase-like metal-dependent hydrolase (beta-lactamase superfamily II)/rhodanese-related sulfurtransferase